MAGRGDPLPVPYVHRALLSRLRRDAGRQGAPCRTAACELSVSPAGAFLCAFDAVVRLVIFPFPADGKGTVPAVF